MAHSITFGLPLHDCEWDRIAGRAAFQRSNQRPNIYCRACDKFFEQIRFDDVSFPRQRKIRKLSMRKTAFAVAATLTLSLTGAALAQSASSGSATDNMKNPGSVKSNSEKAMPETTGTAGSRMDSGSSTMAPGSTGAMAPGAGTGQPMPPGGTQPVR